MEKLFRVTALNYDGTVAYSVVCNTEQLPQEIIDGQHDGYMICVEYIEKRTSDEQ